MRKSTTRMIMLKAYLVLAVVVVLAIIFMKWSWGQYQISKRAEVMHERAVSKQEKIQKQLSEIEQRNYLITTETGREDVLVDRFAVKRPGERVLILVEEPEETTVPEQEKTPSMWGRIKAWF